MASGGRYLIDPATGEAVLVERTEPAPAPWELQPAPPEQAPAEPAVPPPRDAPSQPIEQPPEEA